MVKILEKLRKMHNFLLNAMRKNKMSCCDGKKKPKEK